ncbi:MAG: hypothetical protein MJZ03_01325 [archaeon]|nr:hypothetical protein [archaeon]
MMDKTSIEIAGGVSIGFTGHIHCLDLERIDSMMMEIGEWIEEEAGTLMGHIKMSLKTKEEGITLNLTDLSTGVEHHGDLRNSKSANFNFMVATLDVDKSKLERAIMDAIEHHEICLDIDDSKCFHKHHHYE